MTYIETIFTVVCGLCTLGGYGAFVMWRFGHKSNWRCGQTVNESFMLSDQVTAVAIPLNERRSDPRYNTGNIRLVDLDCDSLAEVMSFLSALDLLHLGAVGRSLYSSVMEERVWYMMERQVLLYNQTSLDVNVRIHASDIAHPESESAGDEELDGAIMVKMFQELMGRRLDEAKCTRGVNRLLYCIYLYPAVYLETARQYCYEKGLQMKFVLIKDNIYRFPDEFIASHPGGASILEDALGTDASAAYHLAYHSPVAIELAKSFCVWDHSTWLGIGVYSCLRTLFREGHVDLVRHATFGSRPLSRYPVVFTSGTDSKYATASVVTLNETVGVNTETQLKQHPSVSTASPTRVSTAAPLYEWVLMNYNSLYPSERKCKYESYTLTALEHCAPLTNEVCRSLCSLRNAVTRSPQ